MRPRRVLRWLRRQFTHPYGACTIEGCDEPRQWWGAYCNEHLVEFWQQIGKAEAARRFEYDVRVAMEAQRRLAAQGVIEEAQR